MACETDIDIYSTLWYLKVQHMAGTIDMVLHRRPVTARLSFYLSLTPPSHSLSTFPNMSSQSEATALSVGIEFKINHPEYAWIRR